MFNLNSIGTAAKALFGDSDKSDSRQQPKVQNKDIYSPTLEKMISRAIEDDDLSDEEIAILARRAQKEGVDIEEFEFDLRQRIKERKRNLERLANINPVEALSNSLKSIEQYVNGGSKAIDGDALSAGLALIPGIGQAAALGGLVASFIETPSNRNELKAEIIRLFMLPDNAEHLRQFIVYANSQIIEELSRKNNKSSLKGLISSITVGSEINLVPIWEQKLEEACNMAIENFSNETLLIKTAKDYRPTLLNKLRHGIIKINELEDYDGKMPSDPNELVAIVEMLYDSKKSNPDDWEYVKGAYNRFYSMADRQITGNNALKERLSNCRIKKFGLF